MGCCGDNARNYSPTELFVDLFTLEPQNRNGTIFIIKKLESENLEKVMDKTLKEHLNDSKIMTNTFLEKNFQFRINNALFYCYLKEKPIIKNFLQVKDLDPSNFDSLHRISILLTKNYDKLSLPKINLINKTKHSSDLNNLKLDFSNISINTQKVYDPNLSCDLQLTKPHLTEDLSQIQEEENEYITNEQANEKEDNESEDNSVYDDDEDEINENEEKNKIITKNYIHIKNEISSEIVKNIFHKLSPYINEDDEDEDDENDKNISSNNKEIIRKFRKSKSNVMSGLDINVFDKKRTSGVYNEEDNIINEKGNELKLNSSEKENFDSSKDEKNQKEQKNKILDSVYIEKMRYIDLEIFSELIEILSIYPYLKRISFCDFNLEKEFEGWENIIYLINENNNIRWLDFHKSNMSDIILGLICKAIENKRIRYLDLSENFLTREAAKTLAYFLQKNKTLQRLNLSNNDLEEFKKIGVNYICEPLMCHPNIQYLNFSSMTLTGCGESIANLIKTTKSLKCISLRDCLLNLKDFQYICRALSSDKISKTINNIDISHNDMASDKSLEEIGNMIKVNKTLKYLNMEKMNLNMQNYNYILNGLNENESIIHFSFCFNPKIKPRIILEYFLHRKKLSSLAYIPYKSNINEKETKVEFSLEEKKIIEKFKKKRKKVKLITR
jgi:hypothetical protein